jgi:hypothetical protein
MYSGANILIYQGNGVDALRSIDERWKAHGARAAAADSGSAPHDDRPSCAVCAHGGGRHRERRDANVPRTSAARGTRCAQDREGGHEHERSVSDTACWPVCHRFGAIKDGAVHHLREALRGADAVTGRYFAPSPRAIISASSSAATRAQHFAVTPRPR